MDEIGLLRYAQAHYSRRDVLKIAATVGFGSAFLSVLRVAPTAAATLSVSDVTAAIGTGLDEGPYYVALSKGWWRDMGLNIKATDPPSGIEAMNQVASGQAFSASVGTVVFFNTASKGLPVKMVSQDHGWSSQDNYASVNIVASKASGISKVADLKGKKIGTRLGTDNEGGLAAFLKTAGLTEKDVTVINVPPPQGATALARGSVDAVAHIEPFVSVALQTVPDAFLVTPDNPPIYMPGCTVVAADFLSQHRDVVTAFVTGHDRGMQVARQNPGEMIQINQSYIPDLPIGAAFNALKKLRFDPRMGSQVKDRLAKVTLAAYVEFGLVPSGTDASLLDRVFDSSVSEAVQKAHPEYYSDLPKI
jgi:ABC-type nitrate/sulfonate/bicarbonate transport system substrate-binding protein